VVVIADYCGMVSPHQQITFDSQYPNHFPTRFNFCSVSFVSLDAVRLLLYYEAI